MERGQEEEEEAGEPSEQLTSSRMGSMSATESSHMFVSLLAEGSSIRYDSSMQVCRRSAALLGGMGGWRYSFWAFLLFDLF